MPFVLSEGARIYFRVEGAAAKPFLVLVHALGADHGMWRPQVPALFNDFQVIQVDLRGHGASDVPPGDYSMEQLGRDVLAVVDAAGGGKFAYCGLSLGGMVGQWLGANARGRLTSLVLANTSPRVGEPGRFDARRKDVLERGMSSIEDAVMQRFFSENMLASGNPFVASIRNTLLATDPVGYAGCCAAIRDMNLLDSLKQIHVPSLVIGGDRDVSTPWAGNGELLAAGIPGARSVHLDTAHLSNLEQPAQFSDALLQFLKQ